MLKDRDNMIGELERQLGSIPVAPKA